MAAPRNGQHAEVKAPPRKRFSVGRLVILLLLAGLVVWIGVRVRAAMKTQAETAAEREHAARAAEVVAPAKVELASGKEKQWLPRVALEGTLAPIHEADLGFQVPGKLQSIRVRAGDYVHKGQTLATLDQAQAQAQLEAAQAQLKAAEAQLALSDDSARRTTALVSSGAQAEALGVQATRQKELAQAQAEAAKAQLALAQSSLGNHALTAPFSGYVTKAPSGPGAIVQPGMPLFHLQDVSTLKVVGTVSESDAGLVKQGAPVTVQLDGRTADGKVAAVMASVDPVTRRLPVEAQLPNDPKDPILAGTFVRAQIQGGKTIPVLSFPATVLKPGAQSEVMVVEGGRMRERRIQYTAAPGNEILVRGGLEAADRVIVGPSPEAKDGDPVAAN